MPPAQKMFLLFGIWLRPKSLILVRVGVGVLGAVSSAAV